MQNYLMQFLRFNATVRHLRPQQIGQRVWRRFYRPRISQKAAPPLRQCINPWRHSPIKYTQLDANGNINLLNQTISLTTPHIWHTSALDRLTLYNLHYHDWLQHPDTSPQQGVGLMQAWIKANPFAKGVGWESYCISQRLVNWIKWLIQYPMHTELLLKSSLARQTRYLVKRLETHLLGNHLLQNAKALIFAGLFFHNSESQLWYTKGLALWRKQLQEQILQDGGHFERSPMYHALILEDVLDVINLLQVYQHNETQEFKTLAEKMLRWLWVMSHQDGDIAFFNDATHGVAPRYAELERYAQHFGITLVKPSLRLIELNPTGYFRVQQNPIDLFIDAAPVGPHYQPGHAHADTLSFELSINHRRILVNRGISTYENNALRLWQRSTAAHNTLQVQQRNSSDVWKSFRVGKRARIIHQMAKDRGEDIIIIAAHDGYRPVIHQRTWKITQQQILLVDEIKGTGLYHITQFFHLFPKLCAKRQFNRWMIEEAECLIQILLDKKIDSELQETTHAEGFHRHTPAFSIKAQGQFKLPCTLVTEIRW